MAQKAYVGVYGVARAIAKGYIGIDNVARQIKKAYIGVGGVARPCWNSEKEFTYYGTISPLSLARRGMVAATIGNYAVFYGGETTSAKKIMDVYDESLTKLETITLSSTVTQASGAMAGQYTVFAGGANSTQTISDAVAYNSSLTEVEAPSLSNPRESLAAVSLQGFAFFGGGYSYQTSKPTGDVDVYDSSLVLTAAPSLNTSRDQLAAASAGEFVIFAGGYTTSNSTAVAEAYTSSATKTSISNLNGSRRLLAGVTFNGSALFAGGLGSSTTMAYITRYNESLTKSTVTNLSKSRCHVAGAALSEGVVFFGGQNITASANGAVRILDVYGPDFTRLHVSTTKGNVRAAAAATVINNYALFGGGLTSTSNWLDSIDVFTFM